MTLTWSDQIGSRGRRAWLLLIAGDRVHAFAGASIPGVCAVLGADYEKAGKWSHTTYRLQLAEGVRAIPGRDGWETGTLREALRADTWRDAANALGVSLQVASEFVRVWRPQAAAHWDSVDAAVAAVDEVEAAGADVLVLTIGHPTRRLRDAGYWSWPVLVLDADGQEVGRVTSTPGGGWEATGPGIRLLDAREAAGHGGGSLSLRVAAPAGCRLVHEDPILGADRK